MLRTLLDVRTYPLSFLLAAVVFFAVAAYCARREGVTLRGWILPIFLLGVGAVGGAKLYSMVELGRVGPWEWELTRGYRYPGSILGMLAVLPLIPGLTSPGLSLPRFADAIAAPLAFAVAVARLGCLLNGCCHGTVCAWPWAIQFPAESPAWWSHVQAGLIPASAATSLPVHPLQIYFLGWLLALGLLSLWLRDRSRVPGVVFLSFIGLHNAGKFLLEFTRNEPGAGHIQAMSLGVAVLAAALLAVLTARERRAPLVSAT